jgi:hypothetical protein
MSPNGAHDPERNDSHYQQRLDIGPGWYGQKGKYDQSGKKETGPQACQRFALVALFTL